MSNCIVAGCTKSAVGQGLCSFHYKRKLFGRDLEAPFRPKAILPKNHPVYMAWTNMKTRCDNPKSTQYKWYSGRGIHYCPEWKDFKAFFEDMMPTWQEGLVLDRENNNAGYFKENCRWVSSRQSAINRSSTKLSDEDYSQIRRLWENGEFNQLVLAKMFLVSQGYIWHILKGGGLL